MLREVIPQGRLRWGEASVVVTASTGFAALERFADGSGAILHSYLAVRNVACNLVSLASDLSVL